MSVVFVVIIHLVGQCCSPPIVLDSIETKQQCLAIAKSINDSSKAMTAQCFENVE